MELFVPVVIGRSNCFGFGFFDLALLKPALMFALVGFLCVSSGIVR